jgi:hypothetical protein
MSHLEFVQDWNTNRVLRRVGEDWGERHQTAFLQASRLNVALRPAQAFEVALGDMLRALAAYADAHKARYESEIGTDGVLGQEWLAMASAFLGLLNGESGRFDCGTLDGCVRALALRVGFSKEEADQL